jgi:hypothetical protein
MVDVGCGLTDDTQEFKDKVKAVGGSNKKGGNITGCLNLTLTQHQDTKQSGC